jgi:predicted O-methyltransferase YrrM
MRVGQVGRVLGDVARYRATYPAIRARPLAERSPVDALAELGLRDDQGAQAGYAVARAQLFPDLLERGRDRLHPSFAAKLEDPDAPAHRGVELVYLAVRLLRPAVVVETGTFSGFVSTFILRALADNEQGELVSLDLPARQAIPHAVDHALPAGDEPGWIVPPDLRSRFRLVTGDTRETLEPTLAEVGPIDVFLHDSLHTTRHMLFEYRAAWKALRPGGLLISDDIFMTPAFWLFGKGHRLPFRHVGNVGIVRKPDRG